MVPALRTVLVLVWFSSTAAGPADHLVDLVAEVEAGQHDQQAQREREEDQQAGGDDLGEGTGTHL